MSDAAYTPLFKTSRCRTALLVAVIVLVVAVVVIVLIVLVPKHVKTGTDTSSTLVLNGHWSDWKPWSTCSQSCGSGVQMRDRTCSNPAPLNGGDPCPGSNTEERNCAVWTCPDCSRNCPGGGTLSDCALCSCPGELLHGTVYSRDTYLPLVGVEVFSSQRKWQPLTVTNNSGQFEVADLCLHDPMQTLEFSKEGHVTASESIQVDPGQGDYITSIRLFKIERPYFVEHPVSQAAFVGDVLDLSCEARGVPAPYEYEWFINGTVPVGSTSQQGVLRLTTTSPAQSGLYQCRAVSDAAKSFSRAAQIIIREEAESSCSPTPQSQVVLLPQGCSVDGTQEQSVEVGHCPSDPCISSRPPRSTGCCGPVEADPVLVQCPTFNYKVFRTVTCGCVGCDASTSQQVIVKAFIKDENGVSPLPHTAFYYNNNYFFTDEDGSVELVVPSDKDRVVLHFDANAPRHLAQTKVLRIYPDVTDDYRVTLQGFAQAVQVNPQEKQVINVDGFLGYPSAVSLSLPPSTILTSGGQPIPNPVDVYVGFSDPRDPENIGAAPGEFVYVTEEGYTRQLQTFGVIQLHVVDPVSRDATFSGEAQVAVHTDLLGIEKTMAGEPDARLWYLDELSGQWLDSGPLTFLGGTDRRKRQAAGTAIGRVTLSNRTVTLNIDKPIYERGACQVKVVVYGDQQLTAPVRGISLLVYTRSNNGLGYVGSITGRTDRRGTACLLIPCGYIHEIYATSPLSPVLPDTSHHLPSGFAATNDGQGVRFRSPDADSIQSASGPVHLYTAWTCSQPSSPDYHFQFVVNEVYDIGSLYPAEPLPGQELSWYQEPADSPNRTVCMVRLEVNLGGPGQLDVIANSYQGSSTGPTYGVFLTHLRSIHDVEFGRERTVACVQVRCAHHRPSDDWVYEEYGDFGRPLLRDADDGDLAEAEPGPPTYVDIHLLGQSTELCTFETELPPAPVDGSASEPVYLVDTTDNSLSILLPDRSGPVRDRFSGYYATRGIHSVAYHDVLLQCLMSWGSIATYQCPAS